MTSVLQSGEFHARLEFRPAFLKVFFAFLRAFAPLRSAFDFQAIADARPKAP